jgi:dihydroneopterin aldolase/2-amino-4-hydroxy-6-hydroxymethyldihydropteridine diphosphokinase
VRIDLELATDVLRAARTDDIEAATDYKSISKCVLQLVRESSYGLIETLAEEIARICLREGGVSWVRVRVAKPGALRGARDVGIEIERGALPPSGAEHLVYLGLGSNVDADQSVVEAVDWVRRRFRLQRVSSIYECLASGGPPGQPDFLNLVLECRTGLDPFGVQAELHAIEARMGRVRSGDRYAPRRCDLDLLLFDELSGEHQGVTLPHPQIVSEAFVHVPLLELGPELHHPGSRRRLADLVVDPGVLPEGMRIRDDLALEV